MTTNTLAKYYVPDLFPFVWNCALTQSRNTLSESVMERVRVLLLTELSPSALQYGLIFLLLFRSYFFEERIK
jgi:hypothetical protein